MAAATGGQRLIPEDDVERLCSTLDASELAAACDAASAALAASQGDPSAARQALFSALAAVDAKQGQEAAAREAQRAGAASSLESAAKRDHARKVAAMREWEAEELRLLDKAVAKWPMGTPRRWEQVAAYVRTRTLEEVLLMVKDRQGASATRAKQQEDWKGAAKKRAEVTSQADRREEAFTDVVVEGAWGGEAKGGGGDGGEGGGEAAAAIAAAAKPKSAGSAAAAPAPASSSADWTEAQELALVKALKAVPKDAPGVAEGTVDRWEQVAALVPGKTKAQCMRRFKEIKGAFKASKAASKEQAAA